VKSQALRIGLAMVTRVKKRERERSSRLLLKGPKLKGQRKKDEQERKEIGKNTLGGVNRRDARGGGVEGETFKGELFRDHIRGRRERKAHNARKGGAGDYYGSLKGKNCECSISFGSIPSSET